MKKYIIIITLALVAVCGFNNEAKAQFVDKEAILDSLTTIDPNIVGYFPRWKICEPDLIAQIYQAFLYKGYPADELNREDIQVMGAPKESELDPYDILLLSCGKASMNVVEIESVFGDIMIGYLSGQFIYKGLNRGLYSDDFGGGNKRDYCYIDIPGETPVTPSQAEMITNYLDKPVNVDHAFSLSLFEQALKIGSTGFWLRSVMGTDEVGYHYWSAGEAKVLLQRPLYINNDPATKKGIPYLINAYLGGGYRVTSGLNNDGSLLSWVTSRNLNASPDGKIIFGTDVHAWFHPQAGLSLNVELPMSRIGTEKIEPSSYAMYSIGERSVDFNPNNPLSSSDKTIRKGQVVPLLRATGQVSVFYNLWLDKKNPENYFRFNLGLSYAEVREALYYQVQELAVPNAPYNYYSIEGVDGLDTYKPNEFMDWLYFKVEYRNQAVFPFGISAQISNQIFLGRAYLPLLGNWLYLEAKYSTPIRDARPFEIKNFFMISPVLRLTI
ncbi:MAG TPA: hypothetical protein PLE30_05085 [Candidatus Kapabacteria bacterium]|nr:hypothetical protein [Candidatus Kapabacteria bacterium]